MRRLERTDAGIDFVKLLADHSARKGIAEYSESAIKQFGDEIQRSLTTTATADHRVRGLRAEALFLAVVAGIGKVSLIKAEDNGCVYFTGDDVLVPDFRVIPSDDNQTLIEVKAHRLDGSFGKYFRLSHNYIQKLREYAARTKTVLRIAIFWEEHRLWTLNRVEAFTEGISGERQWSISFARALATNEMALLGDCEIATRAPLRFRVLIDPEKSDSIPPGSSGSFKMVLAGVQLLSQNRVLSDLSAQIAWKLLWHGRWEEIRQDFHYEGEQLLWVDHVFAPPEWDEGESDPAAPVMIGSLSEMISNAYLSGAEHTIHTTATDDILQPGYMGNFIPADFVSLNLDLPLFVFILQPNFEFQEAKQDQSLPDHR